MSSLSVTSGQTITTSTSISGTDDVNVAAGGTISVGVASPDILWSAAATGAGVTIENAGLITQTGTGASARPAIGINNGLTGTLTVINTGTISSSASLGMFFGNVPAGGSETITNSGTISGGNGVAIQFGAGNDSLTLQSGYSIVGRVIGGAGTNTLNLSGSAGGEFRGATEFNGPSGAVSFAGFDNFNVLNVQVGAWTLYGGGYYDTINIAAGATLIVDDHVNSAAHGNPSDGSFGPIGSTLTVNINGTLRLLNPSAINFGFDPTHPENSATGPIILAGSGGVEVSGFFAINPNATIAIAGGVTVLDGLTLVLGTATGNATVNAGAVMEIGYGGASLVNNDDGSTYVDPGNTGSVNGNIFDNGTVKVARLDSYTLGGALTGSGVLQKLASGALTLQGSTNFSGHVLMDGGTLNLAGAITFNQSTVAAVSSSGLSGSGAVTIANSGALVSQQSAAINMSASTGAVTLNNSGTISGGTSLPVNSQIAVVLSNHDDTLINTGVINGLVSLAGGNDLLDSHAGTINGAVLVGPGVSTVTLGAENNAVLLAAGTHTVNGGGGINTVLYNSATAGVNASLALQGQAQGTGVGVDTLSNFQNLIGSNYDDTLEGDGNNNILNGGTGTNTVSYSHAGSGVTVSLLLAGSAQNTVGAGNDTLSNFQNLTGSAFADVLTGDANNNVIDGGGGGDILTGGLGADTFIYNPAGGQVTITDFSHAQGDKIDLSEVGLFFSLNDVLAIASQVGSDAVATRGGNSLTLKNVTLANLTASDFILTAGPTVGPGIGGSPQSGSGTLTGGAGSDWLQGQGGNDTLHGGAGSDYIDGGAGLNTATYDGAYLQYTVNTGQGGAGSVGGGAETGTDILVNIQRIQFVDGYVAYSPNDWAGEVYRLYEATLNRGPDPEGLAGWVHQLIVGTSLQTVADGFVGSVEFQADYGNLNNNDFVTLLYANVLHRAPDPTGLSAWVGLLNSGQDTRSQVVLGFSQSPEDITNSTPAVDQGLWVGDVAAAQVARLYDTVLGRLPDLPGLTGWTQALENGTLPLLQEVNDFVGSAEFQAVYGNLSNTDFVTLLYNNALHRAPDAGLTAWVSLLNSGQYTRAEVVQGFSESPEHVADTAPHIDSGIWLA